MKKSEPILPLPIYDSLYDQYRFDSQCHDESPCSQALTYSKNNLPFFQFLRTSSLSTPFQFYLRKACNDATQNYYKLIEESAVKVESKFEEAFTELPHSFYDDGFDNVDTVIAELNCGNLKGIAPAPGLTPAVGVDYPELVISGLTGLTVRIKIVVEKFVGAFTIEVYDGDQSTGTLVEEIDATGTYVIEIDASSSQAVIAFKDFIDGCEFEISSIECSVVNPLELLLFQDDIQLDETKIKILQLTDGRDCITYCEAAIDYSVVTSGDYYYILDFGDGEVYFSEVFTLKSQKELEKYFKLYWRHTKDLGDSVIFNTANLLCVLYHAIYFDASLFSPEYETAEEFIESGTGEKTSVAKRWQKTIKLEIPKCPPYLTDALSGIFLHDTVKLTDPLNSLKETANTEYTIPIVTSEIEEIFSNCFHKVTLRMVLEKIYNDTSCENYVSMFDCTPSVTPTIDNVSEPSSGVFLLEGSGLAGTFAIVEYNKDGGGWVQTEVYSTINSAGQYEVLFDTNPYLPFTDFDVRVRSLTLTCDKGASSSVDLI